MSPFGLCCFHGLGKCKRSLLCQLPVQRQLARSAHHIGAVRDREWAGGGPGSGRGAKKNDFDFPPAVPSKFDASMFDRIKAVEHRFTK